MPKKVIAQNGSSAVVATMEDIDGGSVEVTSDHITDATDIGRAILTADDDDAVREGIGALGKMGDQSLDGNLTVDGTLTLHNDLDLKQTAQTDANVINFLFGEDDGVVDASIKATATGDNFGQIAVSVRDDSGNLINALTMDGNGKQVIIWADYKVIIGGNGIDISGITSTGKSLIESATPAAARTAIGAGVPLTAASTAALGGVRKMANQDNSTATDVPGVVADLNAIIVKLKTAGMM
ncbi:head fiber protein [Enterobacteriaceae bacterium LUAb1]